MKPIDVMRETVLQSAKEHALRLGLTEKDFLAGAEYALRFFGEFHTHQTNYENHLYKMKEMRCTKKK